MKWKVLKMTAKRCTDCRHTKGIGYDFWCGEGHTEYEVFGAETNCPYYEYHDWSKGVPSRTDKRFVIIGDDNLEFIMQAQLLLPIYDDKERLSLKTCCDLLNALHEENQHFKKALQVAYSTKLTEPTKHTLEVIAKSCGVDLE